MPFDHFDVIAPIFARTNYSSLELMRKLAALPTKGRLLDVGGGTGRVTLGLRADVDEIVIADVSLGMLRQSASLPGLRAVGGYSEALPFPDASFERVIMVDALHHVINHAESACEMFRVLKPGGRIVIQEPDIQTFGVKLIALAEKLLLMRSHFLNADSIAALFPNAKTNIILQDSSAWVIAEKNL
ncbi:MAG: methyltransferase domain-containing protein [Anaerolineales bacterium]|nr:methyltransferase domain-containing protein [Anaerolineales bacterium]